MPLRLIKIFHNWSVILQCKNRCPTVSVASPHKCLTIIISLFLNFSCVTTACFASNHVKHATLWGILAFQICFYGQLEFCGLWLSHVHDLISWGHFVVPLLCPVHHKQSIASFSPWNDSRSLQRSTSLGISSHSTFSWTSTLNDHILITILFWCWAITNMSGILTCLVTTIKSDDRLAL